MTAISPTSCTSEVRAAYPLIRRIERCVVAHVPGYDLGKARGLAAPSGAPSSTRVCRPEPTHGAWKTPFEWQLLYDEVARRWV